MAQLSISNIPILFLCTKIYPHTLGTNIKTRKMVVMVNIPVEIIAVPMLMYMSSAKVTSAMTTMEMLEM